MCNLRIFLMTSSQFFLVALLIVLTSKKSGAQTSGYTVVYVSQTGRDSATCGKSSEPCKSIAQAVYRVEKNGHIYLDGTGTATRPYNCNSSMEHDQHPGITIQKSLTIEGIKSTPHVLCFGDVQFQSIDLKISIVLSGVLFRQTPLIFQDCKLVQVFNCTFRDTSTALKVQIINNTSTQVDIRGSFFMGNNASCVDIFALTNDNQSLTVRVSNTTFSGNGRFGSFLTKGAITIKSDNRKSSSFAKVQISCFKVLYRNNYGYFVNLDLPTATTSEVFSDVTLVDNTISHIKRSSGKSSYNAVKSLYTSRARKTQAEFTNLKCFYNTFLRCLMIQSDEAKVKIQNSSFIGQKILTEKGASIFLESKTYGTLDLVNSRFRRNKAKAGGALFVHSKHGTIELAITLVNFTECAAARHGCAILVGDPQTVKLVTNQTATYKLIATFRGVRIQNCSGVKRKSRWKCKVVNLLLFSGYVDISDSIWTNNFYSIFAALVVANAGGKTDIVISGCTFLRNAIAVMFPSFSKMAGSVIVNNTEISNQQSKKYAFLLSPKFNIRLINMLFNSNALGLAIFSFVRMHYTFPVNIYIYNCTFLENAHDIVVNLLGPTKIQFTINSTIFITRKASRNEFAISFAVKPLMKLNLSYAAIELDNNTFNSRPCNVFRLNVPGNKTLKIKRSIFRGGICLHRYSPRNNDYEIGTGAISVISNHNTLKTPRCVEKYTTENTHPLWNYDTEVLFEDTTFEENAGLITGAVYISNGNVTFNRCVFRNNFAAKRSGHIYSAYGTGRVNFNDCSFSTSMANLTVNDTAFQKSTFLYSENGGPIMFQNTSMVSSIAQRSPFAVVDISNGGYVDMDRRSTIECSIGSQLLFENNTHFVYLYNELNGLNGSPCRVNVTVLKYSCHLCSPGFYSLQKGFSHGLNVHTSVKCLPCPFGATCIDKNIAAKLNFWGYPSSNHPPSLSFYACPEHYCQSPKTDSNDYNSCYGSRTGLLCGKCASEYSETLFSTECRKRTECNNYMLWIITLLYTIGLAFYLLIKPPVMSFLGRQLVWFRRRGDYHVTEEHGQVDAPTDSGYLKIVFYFYQAAELLIIGSEKDLVPQKIPFVFSIIDAFNFQVRTLHRVVDCPFVGLTAVTKELLLSGTVFLTMAELVVMYFLHVTFNKIRQKQIPPPLHFMAAVIELLLLGYERLAKTSLTLMHCVTIGSQKRLFIDAEVACWQWWQYIVLAYIIVFVVPFIIVLYFGSYKLHKSSISSREFLGACVFPLPFLIYWFLRKMLTITDNGSESTQTNAGVLEILHAPFRQPNDNDNGTIYWESVLIGRRFLLLVCYAFITNTMFRMLCMTAVCVLILLHHDLKSPYRDPIANKCETCSLLVLVMLAIINLTKATLISSGTSIVGPTKSYMKAFNWFQICALALLPTMLSIFVVFAIFTQLVRLMVSVGKLIHRYVWWRRLNLRLPRELETPILNSSEREGPSSDITQDHS